MKRAFFAIALLSISWLPGIGYFHLPDAVTWGALILVGVLLLVRTTAWQIAKPPFGSEPQGRRQAAIAAILCAIACIWLPGPYRAIPLLLACGMALQALPIPVRWPRSLGWAAISAGVILLVQAMALFAYTQLTARSHELPDVLTFPILALAKWIGIAVGYDGDNIPLGTMRANHMMAATWELLIDPATLCFLVGGLVWAGTRSFKASGMFLISVLLWIPARIALMLGLFMHRAMRLDYDAPVLLMDQFWSTGLHLLMLMGAALLACALVRTSEPVAMAPSDRPRGVRWLSPILAFAGAIALALCIYWDPIGARQQGRVVFYELHDNSPGYRVWEPTDAPFDPDTYGHEAAYTYKVLYDYLSHFYDVSRINGKIDDQGLSTCDVLIVKVPTRQLDSSEITAIKSFVAHGGGLMLVGEHTDVFGTGTYLNDIAHKFGFSYRYDCLFDIDEVFQQKYKPDLVPHPIVQNLPELDFAVSCSIAPDDPWQRGAIVSTGLRSLPADYHASNFYPQVEDRAETRYGSFVQLWATPFQRGRVVGFTDSTQFSNFCLFDPGKSELFLGMTEWLNHRTEHTDPRIPLAGIAGIMLLAGWVMGWRSPATMLLACSAGIFGFAISLPVLGALQKRAMPLPKPIESRPLTRVVMDRTICDSTLPLAGFVAGKPEGYGIFERWILRLGYFTTRRSGNDALRDNLLIFTNPDKPVPSDFRNAVERYVSNGGKILVIDSAENQNSTANTLLAPFSVHFKRDSAALNGDLTVTTSASTQPTTNPSPMPVTNALEAATDEGMAGQILARITDKPVSMTVPHGKGTVTLVGYGTRFSDLNMGFTGDNEPDPTLRAVYQVEFDLLRKIVRD